MKVIKRKGNEEEFCLNKIIRAVKLANNTVPTDQQMNDEQTQKVINTVLKKLDGFTTISVEDINTFVEQSLVRHNKYQISKQYILYRENKKKQKKFTTEEEQILSLIDGDSELRGDNANKHIDDNACVRDYIAGTKCKTIAEKILPEKIIKAHKSGLIHWHDMDYSPIQKEHNCFLPSQKFITDKGVRAFKDFNDGENVYVKDKDGNTRLATVHKYEPQVVKEYIFALANGIRKSVFATPNHRWFLNDGTTTENINIGDKLISMNFSQSISIENSEDAKMWCVGFIIGDGCDHGDYCQVRLCGNKNKYIEYFRLANVFRINETSDGDFIPYTKWFHKQDFLNGKCWKFLTPKQKALLFLGLYAADGRTKQNNICSSDERVIELIEECAGMANYFITSKKEEYHDTEYKKNAYLCTIRFLTIPTYRDYSWKLVDVKNYQSNRKQSVYCVVEPITHSFMLENGIPTSNCDLVDADDMLTNTFVMGDTLIEINDETPFRTACNLLAQINLQVSGRQYGGQTVSWSHLLKFVNNSRKMIKKEIIEEWEEDGVVYNRERLNTKVEKRLRKEIQEGVKTYQYQILCHQSSNGQTPFVSNNLCLREAETQQELNDFALIIEEIFKRRIKGVKDKNGHWTTPLFPKLLYWICDGLNYKEGDPYFYLTELAAKCNAYRMQPDIVSEKETRRVKEGQIIPSMGCRSLLSPIWEDTIHSISEEFYWDFGGTYPYNKFNPKRTFAELNNGTYKSGYDEGEICVNFRGNTGWLISKTDTEVIIRQPKVYGRWNNGVVTVNLPHVALEAVNSGRDFYEILDERLELCREALQLRYKRSQEIQAKNSPILWQFGALARMSAEETVGELMEKYPQRASISLGFVGLYETCVALIGQSNTTDEGRKLSKEILAYMNQKCYYWKGQDKINYSIYGTPEEALTYKFALANRRDFGLIERITDKDYVVNSYHVDPRETIDAFTKLEIEGEYLALSAGGAVSYVETGDLTKNIEVIIKIIQWMYEHIVYAEINRIVGVCYECGHEGDMQLVKTENGVFQFICPHCGNTDDSKMNVKARLCGYLGQVNAKNANQGRMDDIYNRKIHLDCYEE